MRPGDQNLLEFERLLKAPGVKKKLLNAGGGIQGCWTGAVEVWDRRSSGYAADSGWPGCVAEA